MYGAEDASQDPAPAAPFGVKLVVIVLLVSGLALAALPLTVYVLGRGAPKGHIVVVNDSGAALSGLRLVRLDEEQERLLGARHDVPEGASLETTYEPSESLRLRVEFSRSGTAHQIPCRLDGPTEPTLRIGPDLAVRAVSGRP